jgi:cyclophilin family peptidyl-prolyl cis-trans isomerase
LKWTAAAWGLAALSILSSVPGRGQPRLRIETQLGAISVELLVDAAPRSVAELSALVREGLPYAGATFSYTRPHQEVRLKTTRPAGAEALSIPTQLDAAALGLEGERVESRGQAMDVLQRELIDAFARGGKQREPGSPLSHWLDTWYRTRDAGFLVGTSRRAINEALGHRYESGLASRAPLRGMVALQPASPTRSSLDLAFLLNDMPIRKGRWMVIGRVTEGLDVVEAISRRPRVPGPRGFRGFEPADPVEAVSLNLR